VSSISSASDRRVGHYPGYDRIWGTLLALTCITPIIFVNDETLWAWDAFHDYGSAGNDKMQLWLIAGSVCGVVAAILGWSGTRATWRHILNLGLGAATVGVVLAVTDARLATPDLARLPGHLNEPIPAMLTGAAAAYVGMGLCVAGPGLILGRVVTLAGAALVTSSFFLPLFGEYSAFDALKLADELSLIRFDNPNPYTILVAAVPGALMLAAACAVLSAILPAGAAHVRCAQVGRLATVWVPLSLPAVLFGGFASSSGATLQLMLPVYWFWIRALAPPLLAIDGAVALVGIGLARR